MQDKPTKSLLSPSRVALALCVPVLLSLWLVLMWSRQDANQWRASYESEKAQNDVLHAQVILERDQVEYAQAKLAQRTSSETHPPIVYTPATRISSYIPTHSASKPDKSPSKN